MNQVSREYFQLLSSYENIFSGFTVKEQTLSPYQKYTKEYNAITNETKEMDFLFLT